MRGLLNGRHGKTASLAFVMLCASALSACGGHSSSSPYLPTSRAATSAQIKQSVAVGGTSLFSDAFANGSSSWNVAAGAWTTCRYPGVDAPAYCSTDAAENTAFAGSPAWTDYVIITKLQIKNLSGSRRGGDVVARAQDASHFYELELATEESGTRWAIYKNNNNSWSQLTGGPLAVVEGQNYWLRFTVVGSTLSGAISTDGTNYTNLGSTTDSTFASGKVGLRTWGGATAAFSDVDVVSPNVMQPLPAPTPVAGAIFTDGFADPSTKWTVVSGSWSGCVTPGTTTAAYCANASDENEAYAGDPGWTDATVTATVTPHDVSGARRGIDVISRYADAQHFYQLELAAESSGPQWAIYKNDANVWTILAHGQTVLDSDRPYVLRLRTSGSTLAASMSTDGSTFAPLGSATDASYASGRIALRTWGGMTASFSNVSVTSPRVTPIPAAIIPASTVPFEPATAASQFVDSIGVNTHISSHLTDTHDVGQLVTALQTLGVRHLRDGVNTAWPDWTNAVNLVLDATGGDLLAIGECASPLGTHPTDIAAIDSLNQSLKHRLTTMEFPNEPDVRGDANWTAHTRSCIANVRAAAPNLKLIAPALVNLGSYNQLGDLGSLVDGANAHRYYTGRNPGTAGWGGAGSCGTYGALDWQICLAQLVSHKDVTITESGWGDGAGGDVDTITQGKYASRLWLENLPYVSRTYWYGAVDYSNSDQFGSHGLLTANFAPKPAFTALQREIAYTRDSGKPSASALRLAIENKPNVHRRLLAKSDGSYQLALWQEVQSMDPDTRVRTTPAGQAVSLTLATPLNAIAHVFQDDGTVIDTNLGRSANFTVTAFDRMTFVELKP